MKHILKHIKSLYKNQRVEYQYLLIQTEDGNIETINISTYNTPNSSITDFKVIDGILSNLDEGAYKFYVVHNHPGVGSNPKPSKIDFRNAELIAMYFSYLGYKLDDYLIYAKSGYFSFAEAAFLVDYSFVNKLKIWNHTKKTFLNEISSDVELIRSEFEKFDVFCISSHKNNNYFVFPLELSKIPEENTYVKSITFIKEEFANAKTLNFIKALYSPELIFSVDNSLNLKLIV